MRVSSLLVLFLFILLSPKPTLFAQGTGTSSTPAETAAAETLRQAQLAFDSGSPDYLLAQRALEQAEATTDLRLQAKANLLQAKLDSAGRRYSRALPYFNRAKELRLQADANDVAAELKTIKDSARAAQEEREAAEKAKLEMAEMLESERSSAQVKYISLIGICMAILAAGVLGFLATVRKLRGDISSARDKQEVSDTGFAKAQTQVAQASRTSMKQLRRVVQSLSARIPEEGAGSAANLLAAHNASLGFLYQSSFEQGDKHEVAMEAFFQKLNPELQRLINANPGISVKTTSMPIRLPVDQAVPLALIYTELVSNAVQNSAKKGEVLTTLTKEGSGVTLTVTNPGASSYDAQPINEGRKLIAFMIDEIGGKMESLDATAMSVRLRFTSVANIATGTHGI